MPDHIQHDAILLNYNFPKNIILYIRDLEFGAINLITLLLLYRKPNYFPAASAKIFLIASVYHAFYIQIFVPYT